MMPPQSSCYSEASAHDRLQLVDAGSFTEWRGPEERERSPHLPRFGLPTVFGDGVVVGTARLGGREVFIAAQDGAFMGGSIGEVHGAKIVGLLLRAAQTHPAAVLLLLDSGGVRLHEANAGELAVAEIVRALLHCRLNHVPIIALVGGGHGAFGGAGIIAGCCTRVVMSERGRVGVTGPEIIETVSGVAEFNSKDRALVWRITGGKHRFLLGEADRCRLVDDTIGGFRDGAIHALSQAEQGPTVEALQRRHAALANRALSFGTCNDSLEIWQKMGWTNPADVSSALPSELMAAADRLRTQNAPGRLP